MRRFRQFCAAIMLACILVVSGSAGDIHCGVVDEQPATSQECAGHIPCGVTGEMPNGVESTDTLTEFLLSLLGDILPLI